MTAEFARRDSDDPTAGEMPNSIVQWSIREEEALVGTAASFVAYSSRSQQSDCETLPWAACFLIVDDSTLHREALAAVVTANATSRPVLAWDVASLRASLNECSPDIVLLNGVSRNSQDFVRVIREKCSHARVIVTGVSEDDESGIVAYAEAGVTGYHLRTESLDELLFLIAKVMIGESYCSPGVSAILLKRLSTLAAQRQPAVKQLGLTAREVQILRMLEIGMSNRDIADRLCIALHTVKNHVHSVLNKLGVSSRAEAAVYSRSLRYDGGSLSELGTASA